jgi:hypothetical protein
MQWYVKSLPHISLALRHLRLYSVRIAGKRYTCDCSLSCIGVDMKRYAAIIPIILLAVAAAGCMGTDQVTDTNSQGVAVNQPYMDEYNLGAEHHFAAMAQFDNGTTAMSKADFLDASNYFADASEEYSLATSDYQNLTQYAQNEDELQFAEAVSNCTGALSKASEDFYLSAHDYQTNDTGNATIRFDEGMDLISYSDEQLNRSQDYTPEWMNA